MLFTSGLALVGPQHCVPPSTRNEAIMWNLMVISALVAVIGTVALALLPWSSSEPIVPRLARSVAQQAEPPGDAQRHCAPLSLKTGLGRACQRRSASRRRATLSRPRDTPALAGRTTQRTMPANRARRPRQHQRLVARRTKVVRLTREAWVRADGPYRKGQRNEFLLHRDQHLNATQSCWPDDQYAQNHGMQLLHSRPVRHTGRRAQ